MFLCLSIQILLHAVTGHTTTILLYHKNFRNFNADVSEAPLANYSSDLPLIAYFSAEKTASNSMSLQNFVLTNSQSVMRDVQYSVLPLFMLHPVAETISTLIDGCLHGISTTTLDPMDTDASRDKAETASARKTKLTAKQALKMETTEGRAAMTLGLQTNLMVAQLQNYIVLTLSYKKAVMHKSRAKAVLRLLIHILVKMLKQPDTSLQELNGKKKLGLK